MWMSVLLAALAFTGFVFGEFRYRQTVRLRDETRHAAARAAATSRLRARIGEFSRPGYRWRQVIEADADYGNAVRTLESLSQTADRVLP